MKTECENINGKDKTIRLSDGKELTYDKLCIATGCAPNKPKIKGIDTENVFLVRESSDQEQIKKVVFQSKNIVVLGGSFIGSESAASVKGALKDKATVHLVYNTKYPFEHVFGKEIGELMESNHRSKGVELHGETTIKEIVSEDGKVKKVKLENGEELEADLVIIGVGCTPRTKFAKNVIKLDDKGGVVVDPFL